METNETDKPFKLNVLGLFTLDTTIKKMSYKEILLLIVVIMVFILAIVFVLKLYAIPGLGLSAITAKISKSAIGKIMKSRAP